MFSKLYVSFKKYIKNNYKFLIALVVCVLLSVIKLPYYISFTGGQIDLTKRINLDNSNIKGSMGMAYVNEIRATPITYLYALVNKNWDIFKETDVVLDNQTIKEMDYRNEIMLRESMSNALYVGEKEAIGSAKKYNNHIYITYVLENAKTDLKVGDEIISIDSIEIKNKEQMYSIIKKYKVDDVVTIRVKNKDKISDKTATLIKEDDRAIVGISFSEVFDVDSNTNVSFSFKDRESGPSGGMMMALTTYNFLTDEDITYGKKIVGTGTIDENGNVGAIGGVKYKLLGAIKKKADVFIVPSGENYDEAMNIINKGHYDIDVIEAKTFTQVVSELKKLENR